MQSERVRSSHWQTNDGQQAACDKDADSASAVVGDGRHLGFEAASQGRPPGHLCRPSRPTIDQDGSKLKGPHARLVWFHQLQMQTDGGRNMKIDCGEGKAVKQEDTEEVAYC